MTAATPMLATSQGRQLLERLAIEHEVDADSLSDLLRASEKYSGQLRRKSLFQAFDAILDTTGR
jgi:hypothetical protein